jgi:dimethylhistidine N-methyltransferase
MTMGRPALRTAPVSFADRARATFARDVRDGLTATPRSLPSRWLYDDVGSALFEAITFLPEYGLTRAEQRILDSHADSMAVRMPASPIVVELGAGSGKKTRRLIGAMATREPVLYCPVDVSAQALTACARNFDGVERVEVDMIEDEYLSGLDTALARRGDRPAVVLFLGSTIGNFDREAADEFLADVRSRLRPGDVLLLATDLVKPMSVLLPAYDDAAGVTAAFDRNVLARINRELDGTLDVQAFRHEARWNEERRRVEMHLVATRPMRARVGAAELEVRFETGESIWTESSHKYDLSELPALGQRAGFSAAGRWLDASWGFAETLFVAT